MATNANWTVVFDDKMIIKQSGDGAGSYIINDDNFWNQSKFSNIWAIQHGTSVTSDEVEYRDTTDNSSYADANLGDIQDFIDKWDAAHLSQLQSDWDNDNVEDETEAQKIDRLGARPTSYSS
tara:strand:- start:6968 stop:7333 length:366 start_codon:yes stop_codon:yes gene_type:complete